MSLAEDSSGTSQVPNDLSVTKQSPFSSSIGGQQDRVVNWSSGSDSEEAPAVSLGSETPSLLDNGAEPVATHEAPDAAAQLKDISMQAATVKAQTQGEHTAATDILWAYEADASASQTPAADEDDDELLAMLAAVHPEHNLGAGKAEPPAEPSSAARRNAETGNAAQPMVLEPRQAMEEVMALRRHMIIAVARIRSLEAEKAAAARRLAAATSCSHQETPKVRHLLNPWSNICTSEEGLSHNIFELLPQPQ